MSLFVTFLWFFFFSLFGWQLYLSRDELVEKKIRVKTSVKTFSLSQMEKHTLSLYNFFLSRYSFLKIWHLVFWCLIIIIMIDNIWYAPFFPIIFNFVYLESYVSINKHHLQKKCLLLLNIRFIFRRKTALFFALTIVAHINSLKLWYFMKFLDFSLFSNNLQFLLIHLSI